MKILAALLVCLVRAGSASPSEIETLIESAGSLPAEFAADALIRLASVEQLAQSRRVELLQQAFERAAAAQEPYKRRAAIIRFGGPAGFLNRVYSQDLDALSLRLRAVSALLSLDSRKAASLFLAIPKLRPPAAACAEFMVPDVSRFYEVLGALVTSQALQLKDLERYVAGLSSPAEIAPVVRTIASAHLSDAEFQQLIAVLSTALPKISAEDRTFTHYAASGRQIELLGEECRRRKISALSLLEGYRAYLVRHLTAARCADDELLMPAVGISGFATSDEADARATDAVSFFNDRLLAAPLKPIGEAEATPAGLEGTAAGLHSCEDAACKSISEEFHVLVFNSNGTPLQQVEKDTPEWHARLQALLKTVAEWKSGAGVSAAAHFREKCGLYSDLAAAVPTTADREAVLRALLEFTGRNSFQVKNRLEWFLPVNGLIGRAGLDPAGLAGLSESLRKSDDPVIAFFARLEAVAPRTPDKILPLI